MIEKEVKIRLLFNEIERGNKAAFEELFNCYYDKLLLFAKQYTNQRESAEEMISELFVRLWLKRDHLSKVMRPEVYLYVSVKNACLNFLRSTRSRSVRLQDDEEQSVLQRLAAPLQHTPEQKELERIVDRAVAALPAQRQLIFKLMKEDGFKSSEVAELLGISKRTVENQLYRAIKSLSEVISHYLGYPLSSPKDQKKLPASLQLLFF